MWVLLRGLARESGHWGNFPPLLADRVGVAPLSLDLPGCGSRNGETAGTTVQQLLAQVRSDCRNHDKKFLVGVSLGGMVAMQWAHDFPEEVAGVVVINSSARNLNRPLQRFSLNAVRTFLQAATSRACDREEKILELVCNSESVRRRYLPTFKVLAEHRPVSAHNVARQLFAASRFSLGRLDVPGLVVASEKDRLASPQCSRAIAAHLNWPLVIHPTAGHDLALEDPAWLSDQIASWRERL